MGLDLGDAFEATLSTQTRDAIKAARQLWWGEMGAGMGLDEDGSGAGEAHRARAGQADARQPEVAAAGDDLLQLGLGDMAEAKLSTQARDAMAVARRMRRCGWSRARLRDHRLRR